VSFQQSKMFAHGVRCSDCHDPHTARVYVNGNDLCLRCHRSELASYEHTHHSKDGPGTLCVSCHMPQTVYMVRDPRRDTRSPSRIPKPPWSLGRRTRATDATLGKGRNGPLTEYGAGTRTERRVASAAPSREPSSKVGSATRRASRD